MSETAADEAAAGGATRVTVAAYDAYAAAYAAAAADLPDPVRARLDDLVAQVPPGARVLEIGSGGGRDAGYLTRRGLSVRLTDVSTGFVSLLRAAGHDAERLDPLLDDLADHGGGGDGRYDAVWANASLLHVARTDLPVVLARLAAVTRPGGVLMLSLKAGDGEVWSTHGSIEAPRRFVLWRPAPLAAVVEGAGWQVTASGESDGHRGERWLLLTARLPPSAP